jgi:hypothetical protein
VLGQERSAMCAVQVEADRVQATGQDIIHSHGVLTAMSGHVRTM